MDQLKVKVQQQEQEVKVGNLVASTLVIRKKKWGPAEI